MVIKDMDKAKKKRIKRIISLVCAAAILIFIAALPLIAGGNEEADGPQASILSGTVERKDVSAVLIGGGALSEDAAEEITIPTEVKLTGYLVNNGDVVKEGDAIASVDRVTVMTAIAEVQETLDYLADEIEAVGDEENSDEVNATAGGIVKVLYAEEGDSVQDIMLTHGALAVLSLDGLMAVEIEADSTLYAGDDVTVTLSDGTEVTGRVDSNLNGMMVVTVTDDEYEIGETVQITAEDGTVLGSGELYIYSPWNATAYSGTVSDINVSEEEKVSSGETLMELSDTGHTAAYQQLSNQHREYEKLMLELFKMYQDMVITAPSDGVVSGVDEDSANLLASEETEWKISLLANAPNGDDETIYVNNIGQVSAISEHGWNVNVNPEGLVVTDYKDLSTVPLDTALMTEQMGYVPQAPIYELVEGNWQQLENTDIAVGDVLLFASNENGEIVWVVRIADSSITPAPSVPTDPSIPTDPVQPSDPSGSGTATPSQPSTTFPQMSGSMSGFTGMYGTVTEEEEKFELYDLTGVQVAAVTPQNTMTLEITIDELDISKVSIGQTANITVDALFGEAFTGTVTEIANTATNNGGNSKFTVTLTLDRGSDMLAGMNATASITLDTATNAVSVPIAALNDNGTETVVYTGYDEDSGELLDPITVTVGASDGENAEITSGLEEGVTYYYAYYDTLEISNSVEMSGSFGFGGGFGR